MTELGGGSAEQAGPLGSAPRRPKQVLLAAIVVAVIGLLGTLMAMLLLSILADEESHGRDVGAAYAISVVSLIMSLIQIGSAVLIFLGQNWGRLLAIGVSGLIIASNLFAVFGGSIVPGCIGIIVNIAIIRMLMRDEVREWCTP